MTTSDTGVDLTSFELARIAVLLSQREGELAGPLAAELTAGGRSNLTYRITDGQTSWVLRTPPRVGRTPSAHDVAREHRITSALHTSAVPVARPVLLCEDESILGAPFTVAAWVDGLVLRTRSDLTPLTEEALTAVVTSTVGALVDLHRVDVTAVGLSSLARPEGYFARQLRRWTGQWDLVAPQALRRLGQHTAQLLAAIDPPQQRTALVHGDYRIDNLLLALDSNPTCTVRAVLDWELATIGDPVADVATMCAYASPDFDLIVGEHSAWASPLLPGPDAIAALYENSSGAGLPDWQAHLALANFKIAVIAAGIAHRNRLGASSGPGHETAAEAVEPFLQHSRTALRSLR